MPGVLVLFLECPGLQHAQSRYSGEAEYSGEAGTRGEAAANEFSGEQAAADKEHSIWTMWTWTLWGEAAAKGWEYVGSICTRHMDPAPTAREPLSIPPRLPIAPYPPLPVEPIVSHSPQ
jgi:hypothetical protein